MKNNPKQIAIIKAAISCIAKNGIEGSSADVIANKLGIAQSGIFYYFPKQELLFDSLVGYIAESNHGIVTRYLEKQGAVSCFDRLSGHIAGNLLWAEKHPDQVSVLLLSIAKTGRSPAMKQRIQRLFQVGEERIAALIAEGRSTQEFVCVGKHTAALIHKALTGAIVSYYYARPQRSRDYFQKLLLDLLAVQLRP